MDFTDIKSHVLNRINNTPITTSPFFSLYIESIFPAEFYQRLYNHMLFVKYNKPLEPRTWDNPAYVNKRYKLESDSTDVIKTLIELFDDAEVKAAFMEKFFVSGSSYVDEIEFTHDLQFVFTERNRFQVIHTDIPAQFLSVVFYMPEAELSSTEEMANGTVLYGKDLTPVSIAPYRANSVVCFAPHFYSYHGFNTTIDNRSSMQFFYAQRDLIKRFYEDVMNEKGEQDVEMFKQIVFWKLTKYRLREYMADDRGNDMGFLSKLLREWGHCRVNTVNGRIVTEN
jgi:hypothetical protein